MWFVFAVMTALFWGLADLFYKKGSAAEDRYSHLKITVAVGLVMGAHATVTLLTNPGVFSPADMLKYLPVSAMYISSMMVGYFGLRYLELSVASPVQNASGAIVSLLCIIFLAAKVTAIEISGMVLVTAGVVLLGVFERETPRLGEAKYHKGFNAILFPIIYCILDGLGTFGDALYLDEFELISEKAALIAYEYTFFICAVVIFIYLKFIKKQKFAFVTEKNRFAAALLETAGQYFYVYAMSGRAVVAAPLIACYSAFSVIFSRAFLKEKLELRQYLAVAAVLVGVACMGLAEGLSDG